MLRRNSTSICPFGDFNQRWYVLYNLTKVLYHNFSTNMQVFTTFRFYEKNIILNSLESPFYRTSKMRVKLYYTYHLWLKSPWGQIEVEFLHSISTFFLFYSLSSQKFKYSHWEHLCSFALLSGSIPSFTISFISLMVLKRDFLWSFISSIL